MRPRARWLILLAVAFGVGAVWLIWQRDMRAIEAQLAASARVIQTSFGPVAFAEGWQGAPVLVIHGAGGGHDQGALMARAFLPEAYRWIAPSRFGYPGSSLPANPSTAAQADAFAELLDGLGIDRATVAAMSGGVPPALQFALRHPERTQALILLSLAPFAPLTADEQELPIPIWLYDALFATDLPLWAVLRLAPRALAPVFDARPDLTGQMAESVRHTTVVRILKNRSSLKPTVSAPESDMMIRVSPCTGVILPVSRHMSALVASTTGTKPPTSSTKPSQSRPASV